MQPSVRVFTSGNRYPVKTYQGKQFRPPRRYVGKRARVVPGYTQTSGYYGRYSGAGGELKFFDVEVDDAVVAGAGVIQTATGSINVIAQGVTEKTRIGRKCVIKSILWRYNLELLASADVGASETVRCIVYLDKQCNGAIATVTGILESTNYQSFNNLANSGRFRILYDRVHALNPTAAAGNGTANDVPSFEMNASFYKKVNIPIEFDSTTGAITEMRSNNLCIMTVTRVGDLCKLDSKVRLRFSDS